MSTKRLVKAMLICVILVLAFATVLTGCELEEPVEEATYYIASGEIAGEPNYYYKDHTTTKERIDEFTDSITSLRTYLDGESFVDTGYYMAVNYGIDILDQEGNTAGNFQLRVNAFLYTYPYEYEDETGAVHPIYKYYEKGQYYDENNAEGTRKLVNALEIHNEAIKKSDIAIEWYNGSTNEVMIGLYFDGLNNDSENPGNMLYVDIQGARRSFPEFGDTVMFQQLIRLLVHLSVEGLLESLGLQGDAGMSTVNEYMTSLIGENSRRIVNGDIVSLYFYQVVLSVIAGNVTEMLQKMFGVFERKWDPLTYKYLGFRFSTVANASVNSLEIDMQGIVSPDKEGNTNVMTDAVFDLRGTVKDEMDVPYTYTSHITFDYGWTYPEGELEVENPDWYKEFDYGNYEFTGLLYVPSWDSQFDALIRTDIQPYDNALNNVFIEFTDIANGELMIGVYYKNERSYLDITGLSYMYGWIDLEYLGFPQVYDESLDLAYVLKQFFKMINNTIVSIVDGILNPKKDDSENQVLDYIMAKTEMTEKIVFSTEDEANYRAALEKGTEALITREDIRDLMVDAGFGEDVGKIIEESPSKEYAQSALSALAYFNINTEEGRSGLEEALSWYDNIDLTVSQLRSRLVAQNLDESVINKTVNTYIEEAVMRKKRTSLFSANTEQLTVDIELVKQMLAETGVGVFTTRQLINIMDSVLPYTLDQLAVMLGVASAELMVEKTFFDLKLDVDTNEMTIMMKTNLGVEPGEPPTLMWQLDLVPVHFGEKVAIADVDFSKFKPLGEILTYSGTLKGNFVFSAAEQVDLSKLLSATIGESSGLNTPYVLPNNVGIYMEMTYDQFVTDNYVNDDGETVDVTDPSGYWKLQGRSAFDITMKIMGEDTVIIRICSDDVCFDNDIYKMLGDDRSKEENSEGMDLLGYIWVSIECVTKNGQQAIPKVKIREDIFMASMTAYMNGAEEIADDVTTFAENDFNLSLTSIISALCKDAYVVPEPEQLEITSSNETLQSLFRVDGLIGNIKVDAGFTYRVKGLGSIKPNYYLHQVGVFDDIEGKNPYETALHDTLETYFYTDNSDVYVLRDSTEYTNDYENYAEAHKRNKTVVTECDYHVFGNDILLDDGTLIEAGTIMLFDLGAKRVINREKISAQSSFFKEEGEENQDISQVCFLLSSLSGLVSQEGANYYYRDFFNNFVLIPATYIKEEGTTIYIYWQGIRDVVFYDEGTSYYFFDMNAIMYYKVSTDEHMEGENLLLYQAEFRKLLFEYDEDSVEVTAACKTQYSPRTKGSFMGVVRRYYVTMTSKINEELGSLYGVYYNSQTSWPPQYYTVAPEGDDTYAYDDNHTVKVYDDDGKLEDWYYDPIALFVMEPAEALPTQATFSVCTDVNAKTLVNKTNWTPESVEPHDRSVWSPLSSYKFNCEFIIDWDSVTLDGYMIVTEVVVARGMMGETTYPCRIIVTNRRIQTDEQASVYDEDNYVYESVEAEAGKEIPENSYYVVSEGEYVLTGDKKFVDGTTYYARKYVASSVPVIDSFDVDPYEYLLAKYEYMSNQKNFDTSSVTTIEEYQEVYNKAEAKFIHEYFSKVVFNITFAWEKSILYTTGVQDEYIAKSYTNAVQGVPTVYDWKFDMNDLGNNIERLINPTGGVIYLHTRFHGQLVALHVNVGARTFAYVKFNTDDGYGNVVEDSFTYDQMKTSKATFGMTINGIYIANYYDTSTYTIGTQPVFVFVDEDGLEYEYVFDMKIITGLSGSNYTENVSYELNWSNALITNVGSEGSYYPEYVYTDLYDTEFFQPIKSSQVEYNGTSELSLTDGERNTYIDRFEAVTGNDGLPVLYEELTSAQKVAKVYLYGQGSTEFLLYRQNENGYAEIRVPLYKNVDGIAYRLSAELYREEGEVMLTYRNEPIPYSSLSTEQKTYKVQVKTTIGTETLPLYYKDSDENACMRKVYSFGTKYQEYSMYSFLTMKVLRGEEVLYASLTEEQKGMTADILVSGELQSENLFVSENGIAKILRGNLFSQTEYEYVVTRENKKIPYRLLTKDQKEEQVNVTGTDGKLDLYKEEDITGYAMKRKVDTYSSEREIYYVYNFVSDETLVDVDEEEAQTKVLLYQNPEQKDLFRQGSGKVEMRVADIYIPTLLTENNVLYSALTPEQQAMQVVVSGSLVNLYSVKDGKAMILRPSQYNSTYSAFTVGGEAVKYDLLTSAMQTLEVDTSEGKKLLYTKNGDGNVEMLSPLSYSNSYVAYKQYLYNDYYLLLVDDEGELYPYDNLSDSAKQKRVTVAEKDVTEPYYINVGGKIAIRKGYWYTENEWETFELVYAERFKALEPTFTSLADLNASTKIQVTVLEKNYSANLFTFEDGVVKIRKVKTAGEGTLTLFINGEPVKYADLTTEEIASGLFIANQSGNALLKVGSLYEEDWEIFTVKGDTLTDINDLPTELTTQKVKVCPDGQEVNLYKLSEENGYCLQRNRYTDSISGVIQTEYLSVEYGNKRAYLYIYDSEGNLSVRSDEKQTINRPFYEYSYFTEQEKVLVYKGSEYIYTYELVTENGVAVLYSSLTNDQKNDYIVGDSGTEYPTYIATSQATAVPESNYYTYNGSSTQTGDAYKRVDISLNSSNTSQITMATLNFYYLFRLFASIDGEIRPISVVTGEVITIEEAGAAGRTDFPSVTARIVAECPKLDPAVKNEKVEDYFQGGEFSPNDIDIATYGNLFRVNSESGLVEIRIAKNYDQGSIFLYINGTTLNYDTGLLESEKNENYFGSSNAGNIVVRIASTYTEQWKTFSVGGRTFTSLSVLSKEMQVRKVPVGDTVSGYYRVDPLKATSVYLPDTITIWFEGDNGLRQGHNFSNLEWCAYFDELTGEGFDTIHYLDDNNEEQALQVIAYDEEEGTYKVVLDLDTPLTTKIMTRIGNKTSGYIYLTVALQILSKDPTRILFYTDMESAEADNERENNAEDRKDYITSISQKTVKILSQDQSGKTTTDNHMYFTMTVNTFENDLSLPPVLVACFTTHFTAYEVRWTTLSGSTDYMLKPNTTVHLVSYITEEQNGETVEVDLKIYLDIEVQNYELTGISIPASDDIETKSYFEQYVQVCFENDTRAFYQLKDLVHLDRSSTVYDELGFYALDQFKNKGYIVISTGSGLDKDVNNTESEEVVPAGRIGLFAGIEQNGVVVYHELVGYKTVYDFLQMIYKMADIKIELTSFSYAIPYTQARFEDIATGETTYSPLSYCTLSFAKAGSFQLNTTYHNTTTGHDYRLKVTEEDGVKYVNVGDANNNYSLIPLYELTGLIIADNLRGNEKVKGATEYDSRDIRGWKIKEVRQNGILDTTFTDYTLTDCVRYAGNGIQSDLGNFTEITLYNGLQTMTMTKAEFDYRIEYLYYTIDLPAESDRTKTITKTMGINNLNTLLNVNDLIAYTDDAGKAYALTYAEFKDSSVYGKYTVSIGVKEKSYDLKCTTIFHGGYYLPEESKSMKINCYSDSGEALYLSGFVFGREIYFEVTTAHSLNGSVYSNVARPISYGGSGNELSEWYIERITNIPFEYMTEGQILTYVTPEIIYNTGNSSGGSFTASVLTAEGFRIKMDFQLQTMLETNKNFVTPSYETAATFAIKEGSEGIIVVDNIYDYAGAERKQNYFGTTAYLPKKVELSLNTGENGTDGKAIMQVVTVSDIVWNLTAEWLGRLTNLDYRGTNGDAVSFAEAQVLGCAVAKDGKTVFVGQITLQLSIRIMSAEVDILPWSDTEIGLETITTGSGSSKKFTVYVDTYNNINSSCFTNSGTFTLPINFIARFKTEAGDTTVRTADFENVTYKMSGNKVSVIYYNMDGINLTKMMASGSELNGISLTNQNVLHLSVDLGYEQRLNIDFYFYNKTQRVTQPIYSITDNDMRLAIKDSLLDTLETYESSLIASVNMKRVKYNLELLVDNAQEIFAMMLSSYMPTAGEIQDLKTEEAIAEKLYSRIREIVLEKELPELESSLSYSKAWSEDECYVYAMYFLKETAKSLATTYATNILTVISRSSVSTKLKSVETQLTAYKNAISLQGYSAIIQNYMEREFTHLFSDYFTGITDEEYNYSFAYKNAVEGNFDTEHLISSVQKLKTMLSSATNIVLCARQLDLTYASLYGYINIEDSENDAEDLYKALMIEEIFRSVIKTDAQFGLREKNRFVATGNNALREIRQTVIQSLLMRMGLETDYYYYTQTDYADITSGTACVLDSNGFFVPVSDFANRADKNRYVYTSAGYAVQQFEHGSNRPMTSISNEKTVAKYIFYERISSDSVNAYSSSVYTGGTVTGVTSLTWEGYQTLVSSGTYSTKEIRMTVSALVERWFDFTEASSALTAFWKRDNMKKSVIAYNYTQIANYASSINTLRKNLINGSDCTTSLTTLLKKAVDNFTSGIYLEQQYVEGIRLVRILNCDMEEVYVLSATETYGSYVTYYTISQAQIASDISDEAFSELELYEMDKNGYYFRTDDTKYNKKKYYYTFKLHTASEQYLPVTIQQSMQNTSTLVVAAGMEVPSGRYYERVYDKTTQTMQYTLTDDDKFILRKQYYYLGNSQSLLSILPITTVYGRGAESQFSSAVYYEFSPVRVLDEDSEVLVVCEGQSIATAGEPIYEYNSETNKFVVTSNSEFISRTYYTRAILTGSEAGGRPASAIDDSENVRISGTLNLSDFYYIYSTVALNGKYQYSASATAVATVKENEPINSIYYQARTIRNDKASDYEPVYQGTETFDSNLEYYIYNTITKEYVLQTGMTSFTHGETYATKYYKNTEVFDSERTYYVYDNEKGMTAVNISSFNAGTDYYLSGIRYEVVTSDVFDPDEKYYLLTPSGEYVLQNMSEFIQPYNTYRVLRYREVTDPRDTPDSSITYYVFNDAGEAIALDSVLEFDDDLEYYTRKSANSYVYTLSNQYYTLREDGNYYPTEDTVFSKNHTYYVKQVARSFDSVGTNENYEYKVGMLIGDNSAFVLEKKMSSLYVYESLYQLNSYYNYHEVPTSYYILFDEENGGSAYKTTVKWKNETIGENATYQGGSASLYATLSGNATKATQQVNMIVKAKESVLDMSDSEIVSGESYTAQVYYTIYRTIYARTGSEYSTEYQESIRTLAKELLSLFSSYGMGGTSFTELIRDYCTFALTENAFTSDIETLKGKENAIKAEMLSSEKMTTGCFTDKIILFKKAGEKGSYVATFVQPILSENVWKIESFIAYDQENFAVYQLKNRYANGKIAKQSITVYNPFAFEKSSIPSLIMVGDSLMQIVWKSTAILPTGNLNADQYTIKGNIINESGQEVSMEMYIASWKYLYMYQPTDKITSTFVETDGGKEYFVYMSPLSFYFSIYSSYSAQDKYLVSFSLSVLVENKSTYAMETKSITLKGWEYKNNTFYNGIEEQSGVVSKIFYPYTDSTTFSCSSILLEYGTSDSTREEVMYRQHYLLYWDNTTLLSLLSSPDHAQRSGEISLGNENSGAFTLTTLSGGGSQVKGTYNYEGMSVSTIQIVDKNMDVKTGKDVSGHDTADIDFSYEDITWQIVDYGNNPNKGYLTDGQLEIVKDGKTNAYSIIYSQFKDMSNSANVSLEDMEELMRLSDRSVSGALALSVLGISSTYEMRFERLTGNGIAYYDDIGNRVATEDVANVASTASKISGSVTVVRYGKTETYQLGINAGKTSMTFTRSNQTRTEAEFRTEIISQATTVYGYLYLTTEEGLKQYALSTFALRYYDGDGNLMNDNAIIEAISMSQEGSTGGMITVTANGKDRTYSVTRIAEGNEALQYVDQIDQTIYTAQAFYNLASQADKNVYSYANNGGEYTKKTGAVYRGITTGNRTKYYLPEVGTYLNAKGEEVSGATIDTAKEQADKEVSGIFTVTVGGKSYSYNIIAVYTNTGVQFKYFDGIGQEKAESEILANATIPGYYGWVNVNYSGTKLEYTITRENGSGGLQTYFIADNAASYRYEDFLTRLVGADKKVYQTNVNGIQIGEKKYYYNTAGQVYTDTALTLRATGMSITSSDKTAYIGNAWYFYEKNAIKFYNELKLIQNICSSCHKALTVTEVTEGVYTIACTTPTCLAYTHNVTYTVATKTAVCSCENCSLYNEIANSLIGKSGEVIFVTDISSTLPVSPSDFTLRTNHIDYKNDTMTVRLLWNNDYDTVIKNMKAFVASMYPDVDTTAQEQYARNMFMNWASYSETEKQNIIALATEYMLAKHAKEQNYSDTDAREDAYKLLAINEKFDFESDPEWLAGSGNTSVAVTVLIYVEGATGVYQEKVYVKFIFSDYNPIGYYIQKNTASIVKSFDKYVPLKEENDRNSTYEEARITSAMRAGRVPKNTYFEYNEVLRKYVLTEDTTFQTSKKYYRLVTSSMYIGVRQDYWTGTQSAYKAENKTAPYDNIGDVAYKLLEFLSRMKETEFEESGNIISSTCYLIQVIDVYWIYENDTLTSEKFTILIGDVSYEVSSSILKIDLANK